MNPFKDLRIMVCGESGVDRYFEGTSVRQSQEAPVPIINDLKLTKELPGMAANVVANLNALGVAEAVLFTVNGIDATHTEEITLTYYDVWDPSRESISKDRYLVNGKHFARIDTESNHPVSEFIGQQYLNLLKAYVEEFDAVILQDYGKGLWTEKTLQFIQYVHDNYPDKKIFVDPHQGKDFSEYKGAYLIKPNKKEFAEMATREPWISLFSDMLVITKGELGMTAYTDSETIPSMTNPVKVVDPTGAGDTALSVLACMLMTGHDIQESMELANKAAGIVVQRMGVSTITYEELWT